MCIRDSLHPVFKEIAERPQQIRQHSTIQKRLQDIDHPRDHTLEFYKSIKNKENNDDRCQDQNLKQRRIQVFFSVFLFHCLTGSSFLWAAHQFLITSITHSREKQHPLSQNIHNQFTCIFAQPDFHASMKSDHTNIQVNWDKKCHVSPVKYMARNQTSSLMIS